MRKLSLSDEVKSFEKDFPSLVKFIVICLLLLCLGIISMDMAYKFNNNRVKLTCVKVTQDATACLNLFNK